MPVSGSLYTLGLLLGLLLALATLPAGTRADCGCGMRCTKYSSALQCTRCCTATVRRSVPVQEPEDQPEDVDPLAGVKTRTLERLLQTLEERRAPRPAPWVQRAVQPRRVQAALHYRARRPEPALTSEEGELRRHRTLEQILESVLARRHERTA